MTVIDEDAVEALAETIARRAMANYEPLPYSLAKEFGPTGGVEPEEIIGNAIPEGLPDELYDHVFARAVDLLNAVNDGSGLWRPREDPFTPLA